MQGNLARYDTVLGDGDCGEAFAGGARGMRPYVLHFRQIPPTKLVFAAILWALVVNRNELDVEKMSAPGLIRKIGEVLEGSMGGTSGARKLRIVSLNHYVIVY